MPKFRALLLEGHVYLVSHFKVVHNKGSYRPADQAFKINFTAGTTVNEIEKNGCKIQLHKFELVNFKDIPLRCGNDTFLIGNN